MERTQILDLMGTRLRLYGMKQAASAARLFGGHTPRGDAVRWRQVIKTLSTQPGPPHNCGVDLLQVEIRRE